MGFLKGIQKFFRMKTSKTFFFTIFIPWNFYHKNSPSWHKHRNTCTPETGNSCHWFYMTDMWCVICLFRSDWLKVARNLPEWLVQSHLDSDWLMVVAYVLLIAVTEKKTQLIWILALWLFELLLAKSEKKKIVRYRQDFDVEN